MPDMEKVIGIIDELIVEARKEPKWKAENALRCLKKELLKEQNEQNELVKAMKRDLDLVRSCKVCGNWTECTPDAPPESPEFKMWRDCGGSCKLNWKWRGI